MITKEEARKEIHSVFSNYLPFDGDKEADEVIKALEKDTVSKESYDHEYFLRKELSLKVYKLDRLLEQADLALSKIKTKLRSPRGVCDYFIVDEIEKIINEHNEIVMKFFDFVEKKRRGEVE